MLSSVDLQLDGEVARAVASSFVAQINADRLSVQTALGSGAPISRTAALITAAEKLRLPEPIVNRAIGKHPLTTISYYAPGMAIFFVLFAVGFGSRSFFTERREGTLDRIDRGADHSAGRARGQSLVGLRVRHVESRGDGDRDERGVRRELGTHPGRRPAVRDDGAVGGAAHGARDRAPRSERQAEGMASIVVFGLALLGGNFVFVSAEPTIMRRLALLTPNGWALRGFTDLATNAGSGAVVEPVLAMLLISAVVGGIAASLARRTVVQ